jgi:hypothetical protein
MDNLDIECKGGLCLEPRLSEYLKKRQYYKQNNIDPSVPLEKTYSITSEDVKRMKAFLRGDKGIYDNKKNEKYVEKKMGDNQFQFLSSQLKDDPRLKRLEKKQQRDRDAQSQRYNYDRNFDDRGYNNITDVHEVEEDNSNNNNNDIFEEPLFLDSRDFNYNSRYSLNNKKKVNDVRTYNHPPKIQYKDRFHPTDRNNYQLPHEDNMNSNVKRIIGDVDSYKKQSDRYYQHTCDMDTEHKVVLPGFSSNGKRTLNTSSYQAVPYMTSGETRNIDMESEIINSFPSRASRSLGYRNPVEHYYDYISNDIQDPNHVVMADPRGGVSTRTDNHSTVKPYIREIL